MGLNSKLSILKGPTSPLPKLKYLNRLFEENAVNHPQKIATIYNDVSNGTVRQTTYSELDNAANRLARAMLSHVDPSPNSDGDFVIAVSMPPTDAPILVLLAVWKCGASQLPLNQHTPPTRLQLILNEAKPVLIVTEEDDDERHAAYDGYKAISFRRLNTEATKMSPSLLADKEMLPSFRQPLAVILYTSGSTGIPKGVRLPHEVIYNKLRWQWQEFPFSSTETVCVFKITLTFVDSLSELWIPLLNPEPRSVLVVPKEVTVDPQKLVPLLEEYKVERILLVPSQFRSILMYLELSPQKLLRNIKTWVCSGEPFPVALARQFFKQFPFDSYTLCNFYGSTEIMGDVTYHVIKSEEDISVDDKVPIGIPFANSNIYLLDKQLRPVLQGEMGEIYVSGLNVCAGYVNGREAERFIENTHSVHPDHSRLYRTGDFGTIVNGALMYEGRNDSQVKVRGQKVDLAEIDVALNSVKGINNSVVLCYKPGEIDQEVIAFVTQHDDSNLTGEEIEKLLKLLLPLYAVPQVFVIDKLPLLNNGKVDRQALSKKYAELNDRKTDEENMEIDYSGIPEGRLHAAECLLKTVASVLAGSVRGKISLQSNFYSLGGHSLNSVYTVTKLRDQGYIIGITEFIAAETLLDALKEMKHADSDDVDKISSYKSSVEHYMTEKVTDAHKPIILRMISESFFLKGELEKWLEPQLQREDYLIGVNYYWPYYVKAGLSFVVRSVETGEIISVAVNLDLHDLPPIVEFHHRLKVLNRFYEDLLSPIIEDKLLQGKRKVMIVSTMATETTLTPAENVSVMHFMEDEVMKVCKREGFVGLSAINTSPLTQQLTIDVFNHQVLCDYQLNTYVAPDGSRPFCKAPDTQRVMCTYKEV